MYIVMSDDKPKCIALYWNCLDDNTFLLKPDISYKSDQNVCLPFVISVSQRSFVTVSVISELSHLIISFVLSASLIFLRHV